MVTLTQNHLQFTAHQPFVGEAAPLPATLPEGNPGTRMEAWTALALSHRPGPSTLEDLLESMHLLAGVHPTARDAEWALLGLRRRGLVVLDPAGHDLTGEAREALEGIPLIPFEGAMAHALRSWSRPEPVDEWVVDPEQTLAGPVLDAIRAAASDAPVVLEHWSAAGLKARRIVADAQALEEHLRATMPGDVVCTWRFDKVCTDDNVLRVAKVPDAEGRIPRAAQ